MKKAIGTGKTREEAEQAALDQLGISYEERSEVHVEILDVGSRGFLGFGAREWRVRATLEGEVESVSAPRPMQNQRHDRERNRGERPPRSERPERPERPPRPERGERPEPKARPERGERPEQKDRTPRPERNEQKERPPRPDRPQRQDQPKKDRPERKPQPQQQRNENRPRKEDRPPRPPKPESERRQIVDEGPDFPPVPEEKLAEAVAVFTEMLTMTGIEVTVTAENGEDGRAVLAVSSNDSALLIGRKARNLESLQYLINRMVRVDEAHPGVDRFIVDVENYLERRKEAIADMARAMGRKVKDSGREVRLKPMPARERRIVHVTLQDDPDLKTFSQGTGINKVVVIQSKNMRKARGGGGGHPKHDSGNRDIHPGNRGNHPQGRRQSAHPTQGQRTRRDGRGRGQGGNRQGGAPNVGALD